MKVVSELGNRNVLTKSFTIDLTKGEANDAEVPKDKESDDPADKGEKRADGGSFDDAKSRAEQRLNALRGSVGLESATN